MPEPFKMDALDRRILSFLISDARTPFVEIARRCKVSGAAIHQRVARLKQAGVISEAIFKLNPRAMGYMTSAYIGLQVNLISTRTHTEVFEKIMQIPEIVECHHISGKYSLLIKIHTQNNERLKEIIVSKIQSIPEITFTETFISLEKGFERELAVER
ncbi:MAG: Lrp/AsnC ligand binding domain-containing protein [Bacteroidales bacterium]|jgi:Lrp/AsnC family transcriptional regulator for asnA, asnC and gidA|nr:Lrp/AsnC ligand binding domain-containing protein [Bacteroidales bacterium]